MSQENTRPTTASEIWLTQAEHTAWRKLAGETVVLDLEGHCMFGFNETAAVVWSALVERPIPLHRQTPETVEFLHRLVELGLAQVYEPGASPTAGEAELSAQGASEFPEDLDFQSEPEILWQEKLEQAAATCAFLPGQNVLCGQVPFS